MISFLHTLLHEHATELVPFCNVRLHHITDSVHLLSTVESDQEGGYPVKIRTEQPKIDGFLSRQEEDVCYMKFDAPCTLHGKPFRTEPEADQGKEKKKQPEAMTVFLCIPVAPGRSRLIWAFPRSVDSWLDNIIPRWLYHIVTNTVFDSDSYLLHIEERNFATVGLDNWHKACYVPTSCDNMVITFRNWFRKYCKHQIGWATPMVNQLPPTPTKDQLMERYWSHVMQCTSCSAALKWMRAMEVALQVASVAIVGFLAVAKGSLVTSVVRRAAAVSAAVLCFAASRWLASFVEKSFYFQEYVHAYKPSSTASLVPWRRQWIGRTDAARWLSMPVSAVAAETPLPRAVNEEEMPATGEERFDWLDQWYPVAPVCDLDKRKPHGKMVMGLSVVAWFDGGGEWRVMDDVCPHRLAPLSEGRVDDKGRLQCAYHGWCFDGRGSCQFIPQAPALGPPVHKNSKACVASYPSVVQNNILWFYPRSEPEYRDVLQRKRPPYIPEIDDPSSIINCGVRDLLYGYIYRNLQAKFLSSDKQLDEGGLPIKMNIEELNIAGFHSNPDENWGYFKFIAPVTLIGSPFRAKPAVDQDNNNNNKIEKQQPEVTAVFFCIPVAPGRCRVIWANGYNLDGWFDKITPRWWWHIKTNQVLDSDSSVLHIEERNYAAVGLDNWHKACYVPTSSDNLIITFRKWFKKYSDNQVGWLTPMVNQLPPASTRVEVYERYWSHVMQCTSCSAALKGMRALEVALQVAAVAVVGFLAAGKGTVVTSGVQRAAVVAAAVLCLAASRWLAGFIEKAFYFEDYVLADK
uniref:Rieske domain-containing protein n=1 Tax=Oryza punctata TaxID=4537 RepID=A0A0E0KKF5_ORYPU